VNPRHTTIVDCAPDLCELDQNDEFAIDSLTDSDETVTATSAPATIEGDTSSPSKAPYTRGHRRRSTHVTRRDLEKFHSEVLGVENHASWFDEDNGTPRSFSLDDPQLEELNRAFENADVSMNIASNGMASNGTGPGAFYDNSSSPVNMANMPPRQTPSPAASVTTQINGGMGAMGAIPMNAGHQMDLHHLYEMVVELSDVLKNNRDVTKNIVANAEEIVVCGIQVHSIPSNYRLTHFQKNGIADNTSPNGQQNGDHSSNASMLASGKIQSPLFTNPEQTPESPSLSVPWQRKSFWSPITSTTKRKT
jgi:hypothetical protein